MNTYLKDDVDDEEDGEEEDRFASSVVTSEISTINHIAKLGNGTMTIKSSAH